MGTQTKTIFIDIDNLLILRKAYLDDATEYDLNGSYDINYKLVNIIKEFRQKNPWSLIIFWSTCGAESVKYWLKKLDLEKIVVPLEKNQTNLQLITPNDIVIDHNHIDNLYDIIMTGTQI